MIIGRNKKGQFIKGMRSSPQTEFKKGEKNPGWKDGVWFNNPKEYNKIYREKNREKLREYDKQRREKNREKLREYDKLKVRKRRQIDPKYRLDRSISTAIWFALKGKKAGRKWESLVGYTIDNLINHLEKQFEPWMNWNNYGGRGKKGMWSVDHIKPQSLFNYKTAENPEFRKCWSLENLQPLEAIENMQKSNKYEPIKTTNTHS